MVFNNIVDTYKIGHKYLIVKGILSIYDEMGQGGKGVKKDSDSVN